MVGQSETGADWEVGVRVWVRVDPVGERTAPEPRGLGQLGEMKNVAQTGRSGLGLTRGLK